MRRNFPLDGWDTPQKCMPFLFECQFYLWACLRLAGAFAKFHPASLHRKHTNDGLYIRIEISNQAEASFCINHEGTRAWGRGGRRAPPHCLPCKTVDETMA